MKPNFALSLSIEGIRLLHRAAGGWRVVGQHALDVEDLSGELAMLRKTASSLEPAGVRCKVIIPNDQIRYLTIETEGLNDTARDTAARAALEGATPYAVDDLVYDTTPEGTTTHIAAVARETLLEAETFATEHRFHPVSFVAIPGDAAFLGEPFFGPSSHAATLLSEDDNVEPDGIAVVVIGDVEVPTGPVVPEDEVPMVLINDPALPVETDTEVDGTPADEAKQSDDTDDLPIPEPPKKPEVEKAPPTLTFRPSRKVPKAPASPDKPEPKLEQAQKPEGPIEDPDTKASDDPLEDKLENAAKNIFAPVNSSLIDVPVPPIEGFASKRNPSLDGAVRNNEILSPVENETPKATLAPRPAQPTLAVRPDFAPPPQPVVAPPKPSADGKVKAGFLSRRKPLPPAPPVPPKTKEPKATPAKAKAATAPSETERMTVFGARKDTVVGGKPKFLGLLLMVALLLLLAGVAVWASIYMEDALARLYGREPASTFAGTPDVVTPKPVVPQDIDPSQNEDPVQNTGSDQIITASVEPSLTDEDEAVLDALRAPAEPVEPEPLTQDEIAAQYAVTGIWSQAPDVSEAPQLTSVEDLYLTSIDRISLTQDAIALPDITTQDTDQEIAVMHSPAPAGTVFILDQRGLVIPTATGAINPDGIAVFSGRPPLVPPATFARFQTDAVTNDLPDQPDPQLAKARPNARPGGLIENNERATLDGLTRNELADLRPRLRPQSAQQAAQQASLASLAQPAIDNAVMSILEEQQQTAPVENPLAGATARAVAASIRPDTRPSNFAKIVQRAVRAAPTLQQETRIASAASVAPRTVSPSIPTTASVAREATLKNALNLRKMNLIGVYGKPSSRRALVRLANGRYRKVQVGDRIDGGRVSAIGDSELSYKKGNRNLVLTMPKG